MASVDMTIQNVKDRYEGDLELRFTDKYLETKLADAIALINDDYKSIVERRLASGALSADSYMRIVSDVVLRVVRNPGGYAGENEGGVGYTLRATVASGDLYLTDRDIATLTGIKKTDKALPGTVSIGVDSGWVR